MLNVNQITSMLERLPDAALQQYAAMHKQDPYVLSLAVEESNRRKRMRAAPQAQEGPQPHVNDQAVQAMLPEDTGIAQLPMQAPPITHAAHGGIISFADAGIVDPSGVDTARARLAAAERNLRMYGSKRQLADQAGYAAAKQEYDSAQQAVQQAMTQYQSQLPKEIFGPITQPLTRETSVQMPVAPPGEEEPAALAGLGAAASAQQPPPPPPPPAPRPRPDAGLAGLSGSVSLSGATGAGASYKPMTQSELIQKQIEARNALSAEDPARAQAEAAAKADAEAAEKRFAEYQAAMPKGKAYEGLEASLKKEEAELPQKKEETIKMALINAGLGMLAGTSQYAMANIGAGGKQGMETYQRGLDKLDKAAERRQELVAKIEEARRAEQRGDAKDAYNLRKEADDIKSAWRRDNVSAVRDMFKVNDAAARNIVDNIVRQEGVRAQENIAAMRERGAAARTAASLSAQSNSERAQQLRALSASRAARLSEVQRELASMPMGGLTPEQQTLYKNLIGQRDRLIADMQQLEQHFAQEIGIPATPTTAPPPRAPDYRFDAKGNLIR